MMAGRGSRSALSDLLKQKDRGFILTELEDSGLDLEQSLPDHRPQGLSFREYVDKYVRVLAPQWQWTEVSELIFKELELALKGKSARSMLVVAPRQGKSILAALAVAYAIHEENRHCIWVSANQKLAQSHSIKVLSVLEHAGCELHPRSKSLSEFMPRCRNAATCAIKGQQSGLLGLEASFLVVDDPLPNAQAAESDTFMDRLMREWGASMLSRLTPDAKGRSGVVLIHQRLHTQDMIGRLIQREFTAGKQGRGVPWRYLHVPFLHLERPEEIWERVPDHFKVVTVAKGEVGQPTNSRFDQTRAWEIERGVDPQTFKTLYQGLPSAEDELCSWSPSYLRPMRRELLDANKGAVILALDLALTGGKGNDSHGWAVMAPGIFDLQGKYMILGAGAFKGSVADTFPEILKLAHEYKPSQIIVERLGGGPQMLQLLRERSDLTQHGCSLVGVTPKSRSKHARYRDALAPFAHGLVQVPDDADFLDLVNGQMRQIALRIDRTDDTADALLYAAEQCQNLTKGGFVTSQAEWSRGATFTPKHGGGAVWTRGTSAGGFSEGQFETDPNQPFPGQSLW